MKILFAASEAAPFAKTGGLADVAGSLPGELKRLGHDVRVLMPYYRCVKNSGVAAHRLTERMGVPMADRNVEAGILVGRMQGQVPVYFVEQDGYYDREDLYRTKAGDYQDNAQRFIFFSKSIVALADALGDEFVPDIFHCNDWQTGLAPLLLACRPKEEGRFARSRVVFTVHNLAYQGIFWHLDMPLTNLGWEVFNPEILEFYGKINLLKAGIVGADAITTVSKKYALEIQTPEYGCGLEGVLASRSKSLFGILNGADYGQWNPQTDRFIAQRYGPEALGAKKICKADLLAHFHLPVTGQTPLLGVVSRLADQKGLDILVPAMDAIVAMGAVLVILGTGEEKYHALLKEACARHPQRIGLHLGFDNGLAHKIEAGADMFVMPSRFEPCGLNQIYSMKYGTIPVVRATGGLDDTVQDFDGITGTGNGFKFEAYRTEALTEKIAQALCVYKDDARWARLMRNAMACDFSWHASALEYEKLYNATLGQKRIEL